MQSGNYSSNSCPFNTVDGGDRTAFKPGSRDTGIAVRSKAMAKFFTGILSADMALELAGPQALVAVPQRAPAFLVERAPSKMPSRLYPSKRFGISALEVQPVLSPDNYMDVVPDLLRRAKRSILIQQQYIRAQQQKITDLMEAIAYAKAASPRIDVRILLGKIYDKKDLPKERAMLAHVKKTYGLKLGTHIRYVNTDRLVHCHNKMVLVDGTGVLVSSQNWSQSAVWENREAGLWLRHKGICSYFSAIFETDWKDANKRPSAAAPQTLAPQTLQQGRYIRIEPGDYAEV